MQKERRFSNLEGKIKYLNTGIVFQEIPNQVTLSINISNCPCRCPGCHSSYLWEDVGVPLTANELDRLLAQYQDTITCVCFMGGDRNPQEVSDLAKHLHKAHPELLAAWYSGKQYPPSHVDFHQFNYIKLGPYIQHLGPLNSPSTNQKMFKQNEEGKFVDITSQFWNKKQPGTL